MQQLFPSGQGHGQLEVGKLELWKPRGGKQMKGRGSAGRQLTETAGRE